jgi:L-histidine N-alpha-methyltransferase
MQRTGTIAIDVHLGPGELARQLREDVRSGLTATPKTLRPKWFYDEWGSHLFDEITRLPEYYPTEAERSILTLWSAEIADTSGADTLVELGSGTSDKTQVLLDAMSAAGTLARYVPFDVSEATLREAAGRLADRYPGIDIHGVVGDLDLHLHALPTDGRRLVAFLGGTIGNYPPSARRSFLADLVATLRPGDHLLLGTDLVKDVTRVVAAYDDAAGVTAAFNRNVLEVVNRELGGDFRPERFDHVALWNAEQQWIEMRLRSRGPQTVRLSALDLDVVFADGEDLLTEISAKFTDDRIARELFAAGLEPVDSWTDPDGLFRLTLAAALPARAAGEQ